MRAFAMPRLRPFGPVAASLAILACGGEAQWQEPPRPVRVATVSPELVRGSLRYSANIQATETLPLAFKVGGYVEEILQRRGPEGASRDLQEGDTVRAGEVLARLRESDYLEKGRQADSKLAEAEAAWSQASEDWQRAQSLFGSRSLTKADLDAAKARYEALEAQVEGARALAEEARLALEDAKLRAPRSAVVLERAIEAGSLVGPGTVGFILAEMGQVKAVFGAPGAVVQRLRPGDRLTVTSDSVVGETFAGTITAISPSADPFSRVFDVEVTIDNRAGPLKPGMIAAVVIEDAGSEDVGSPRVPLGAIVRPPGKSSGYAVFVTQSAEGETTAHLRPIEPGDVHGNLVAVHSGVAAGETVVITGATLLTDGEAVRIIPSES